MFRDVRGVTLIELLVAVAILAMLILLGAPLTGSWTNSARAAESRSKLVEAYGMAKAVAMRNPTNALIGNAAASLVWDSANSLLIVCQGASSACNATATTKIWTTSVPAGASFSYQASSASAETSFNSLEISSTGIPTGTQPNNYVATKGDQSEPFTLH